MHAVDARRRRAHTAGESEPVGDVDHELAGDVESTGSAANDAARSAITRAAASTPAPFSSSTGPPATFVGCYPGAAGELETRRALAKDVFPAFVFARLDRRPRPFGHRLGTVPPGLPYADERT